MVERPCQGPNSTGSKLHGVGELKKLMLDEYCPRGEVQKLEQELWNLTVKDSNIEAHISRFSDLALLCPGMITSESKKVERFI